MDNLDLYINPAVKGAHVVKVPCSFSPTGIHYVVLMLGEKTQAERFATNTKTGQNTFVMSTHPHMLYMSSECEDTVPPDVLIGMRDLRRMTPGAKSRMCFETLSSARDTLAMEKGNARDVALSKLPRALQPVLAYIMSSRMIHPEWIKKPTCPYIARTLRERAASKFTKIFNRASGCGNAEDTGPFQILYDEELGFGLANARYRVLARRLNGEWVIPNNWKKVSPWPYEDEDFSRWAKYIDHQNYAKCYVCNKKLGGDGLRTSRGHDPETYFHTKGVIRRVRQGLVATRNMPYIQQVTRPKSLSKYPEINVVSPEDYRTLFSRSGKSLAA